MTDWRTTAAVSALALCLAAPAAAQDRQGTEEAGATQAPAAMQEREDRAARAEGTAGRDLRRERQPALERMARENAMDSRQRGGQMMMLDIDGFSEAIYERGYRQGYIRGIADARANILRHIENYGSRRNANVAEEVATPEAAIAAWYAATGTTPRQDGGAIVVLPRGMTPEMFIQALEEGRFGREAALGQERTSGARYTTPTLPDEAGDAAAADDPAPQEDTAARRPAETRQDTASGTDEGSADQ